MKPSSFVITTLLAVSSVHGALDAKAKAKGKYFGNILGQDTISISQVTNILNTEFGVITPERSMTWGVIEPSRGQFVWSGADAVVNWAVSRGKLLRGQTLVWHSQLPAWVNAITNPSALTQVIQNHINQIAGRYRGRIYHWDVVSEVLEENGQFRGSVFYRALGEEFVDLAFRTARAADPYAKLYLTDYNLDYEGPKLSGTIALIKRLQARGTPIDGLGAQAHLVVGNQTAACRLGSVAEILGGLEIAVIALELGIRTPVNAAQLQQQQRDYEVATRTCLEVPQCVGITVWGISDRQ